MAQFRKKPIIVEAVQWMPGRYFKHFQHGREMWLEKAMNGSDSVIVVDGDKLIVKTLEGVMVANPGDWIIRGVKGELYPCKNDIFMATYDAAEE